MRKLLVCLGVLLLAGCGSGPRGSTTAPQASEVGNGGHGVVCRDEQGKITSVRLLDFFEAKVLRDGDFSLGAPTLSVAEKVSLAISRLKRLDPDRAKKYQEKADQFMANMVFKSKLDLAPLNDYGMTKIPLSCKIEQLCIQKAPKTADEKLYSINLDLWDWLDSDHRAGLRIHEIVYGDALEQGHLDSVRARGFTALISSKELDSMSQADYDDALRKFGLTKSSKPGGVAWLKTPFIDACVGQPYRYFWYETYNNESGPTSGGRKGKIGTINKPAWLGDVEGGYFIGTPKEGDLGRTSFDLSISAEGIKYPVEVQVKVSRCGPRPVAEPTLGKALSIDSANSVTCAIFEETVGSLNRVVRCWRESGPIPLPWLTKNPVQVSVSESNGYTPNICVLDDSGVRCTDPAIAKKIPPLDKPRFVDANGCAIDSTGLKCWMAPYLWGNPVVPTMPDAIAVAVNGIFSCAINNRETVCWGQKLDHKAPKTITHPRKVKKGYGGMCFESDEGVFCIEGNDPGAPVGIVSTNPRDFCFDYATFCALGKDGLVDCSGYNARDVTPPPVLKNPSAISCGNGYACAIDEGVVRCWGKVYDKGNPPGVWPPPPVGSEKPPAMKTSTGVEFKRVADATLKSMGIDPTKFGEAWQDPTGVIWGDLAKGEKKFDDAVTYCNGLGADLPTGYMESQNGKSGFPDKDSDFVRLRKYMGAESVGGYESPKSYNPQILPSLSYKKNSDTIGFQFWSSSFHSDLLSYAYTFYSEVGRVKLTDRSTELSVRCVVRPTASVTK